MIGIYENWSLLKGNSTYMPFLIRAIQMSEGPILELGAGIFSTPLLHWLCAEKRRRLFTYEDNKDFFEFARQFRSRNHRIISVDDWDKIDIEKNWSVVLVDHLIERRAIEALRLKDCADYIVLHDTNVPKYKYEEVWPYFKEVKHWKFCTPWTSVVSNRKNLKIFE